MIKLALLAAAIGALLVETIIEAVFETVFSYIGAGAVWLLTLGRLRIGPLKGGESAFAPVVGLLSVATLLYAICLLVQHH